MSMMESVMSAAQTIDKKHAHKGRAGEHKWWEKKKGIATKKNWAKHTYNGAAGKAWYGENARGDNNSAWAAWGGNNMSSSSDCPATDHHCDNWCRSEWETIHGQWWRRCRVTGWWEARRCDKQARVETLGPEEKLENAPDSGTHENAHGYKCLETGDPGSYAAGCRDEGLEVVWGPGWTCEEAVKRSENPCETHNVVQAKCRLSCGLCDTSVESGGSAAVEPTRDTSVENVGGAAVDENRDARVESGDGAPVKITAGSSNDSGCSDEGLEEVWGADWSCKDVVLRLGDPCTHEVVKAKCRLSCGWCGGDADAAGEENVGAPVESGDGRKDSADSSCANRCGMTSSDERCMCDQWCESNDDCCDDYQDVCVIECPQANLGEKCEGCPQGATCTAKNGPGLCNGDAYCVGLAKDESCFPGFAQCQSGLRCQISAEKWLQMFRGVECTHDNADAISEMMDGCDCECKCEQPAIPGAVCAQNFVKSAAADYGGAEWDCQEVPGCKWMAPTGVSLSMDNMGTCESIELEHGTQQVADGTLQCIQGGLHSGIPAKFNSITQRMSGVVLGGLTQNTKTMKMCSTGQVCDTTARSESDLCLDDEVVVKHGEMVKSGEKNQCLGNGSNFDGPFRVTCRINDTCNTRGTVTGRGATPYHQCITDEHLIPQGSSGRYAGFCFGSRGAVECTDPAKVCTTDDGGAVCGSGRMDDHRANNMV